jgi:NADH-quinone oxidoreductase subunit G
MPCTAKKDEKGRETLEVRGAQSTDAVLVTRELGKLIKMNKIPF